MGGDSILQVESIFQFLESFYKIELSRLRQHVNSLQKEYQSTKDMKGSCINDFLLRETIDAARSRYDSGPEFFYDRKSGLIISGIAWHADFAREFYADIYPDIYKDVGFNEMADHMFEKEKSWGFLSSVGYGFQFQFSMNTKEKMYFKDFIRNLY